jgi:hypothetical protein
MNTTSKTLLLNGVIFFVLAELTLLLSAYLPADHKFCVFLIFAGLFGFLAVTWNNIPIEYFQPRYGTGPYSRIVKIVSTAMLALAALLSFISFLLILSLKLLGRN